MMSNKTLRTIKILIIPAAIVIACLIIFPWGQCGGKHTNPADAYLKHQNDSLMAANKSIQTQKEALMDSVKANRLVIAQLKQRSVETLYKYGQVKANGIKQISEQPCDSVASLAAFMALDSACTVVVLTKDSIITESESNSAKKDEIIVLQEEQICNLQTVKQNTDVYVNILEEKAKDNKKVLRRQRLKTWAVGIAGAVSTALVTYFAFVNK